MFAVEGAKMKAQQFNPCPIELKALYFGSIQYCLEKEFSHIISKKNKEIICSGVLSIMTSKPFSFDCIIPFMHIVKKWPNVL